METYLLETSKKFLTIYQGRNITEIFEFGLRKSYKVYKNIIIGKS